MAIIIALLIMVGLCLIISLRKSRWGFSGIIAIFAGLVFRLLHWGWWEIGVIAGLLSLLLVVFSKNRPRVKKTAITVARAGLALMAILALWSGLQGHAAKQTYRGNHNTTTTTSTSTPMAPAPSQATVTSPGVQSQVQSVIQVPPSNLNIGSSVNWSDHTETRGEAAFSKKTLKTPQDVSNFLNGSSAQSQAAKAQVTSAIEQAGYGQAEVDRALSGTGYFPVQTTVAVNIMGTSYFQNGKVYDEGTGQWRSVGPNDVFWLYLTSDQKIIFNATIRADCGNPHLTKVVPVTTTTPPAPPVTCASQCGAVPTTTTTTVPPGTTTTTICPTCTNTSETHLKTSDPNGTETVGPLPNAPSTTLPYEPATPDNNRVDNTPPPTGTPNGAFTGTDPNGNPSASAANKQNGTTSVGTNADPATQNQNTGQGNTDTTAPPVTGNPFGP